MKNETALIKDAQSIGALFYAMHLISINHEFNFRSDVGYTENGISAKAQGKYELAELFRLASVKVREFM